jgi:hypothetical protein
MRTSTNSTDYEVNDHVNSNDHERTQTRDH